MPRQRLQDGTTSTADASTRYTTRLRHSSPGTRGTRETCSGGATTAGWAVSARLRAGAADRRCDRRRGVEARRHRGAGRLHDRVPGVGRAFGSIRREEFCGQHHVTLTSSGTQAEYLREYRLPDAHGPFTHDGGRQRPVVRPSVHTRSRPGHPGPSPDDIASQHIEVVVAMQHRYAGTDRDGSDQAVDQPPYCLVFTAAARVVPA